MKLPFICLQVVQLACDVIRNLGSLFLSNAPTLKHKPFFPFIFPFTSWIDTKGECETGIVLATLVSFNWEKQTNEQKQQTKHHLSRDVCNKLNFIVQIWTTHIYKWYWEIEEENCYNCFRSIIIKCIDLFEFAPPNNKEVFLDLILKTLFGTPAYFLNTSDL